jgi:hypothetical protein
MIARAGSGNAAISLRKRSAACRDESSSSTAEIDERDGVTGSVDSARTWKQRLEVTVAAGKCEQDAQNDVL